MGAKQSKRSVDISGKEAESAGEVAASIAGGEGRLEQLADADALKPQLNGDAHIHETEEKQKDIDSGTPENEKDATTEKEAKVENEEEKEKEVAPLTNGETEQKVENGDSTPEDGKKPKKEKVKKKWSLRSISFSRKDKPKQEKKAKDEEPKTNGDSEKLPEETAEAAPEVPAVTEAAEEPKTPSEVKEDQTPETPVTEPITNGSSTPESPKVVETPIVEEPAALSPEIESPAPKAETEPEQLPVNGLSLEEPAKEIVESEKNEDSKEETTAETTEIVPEIPVKKEVCVEQMPLIDSTPPPLPANPPPSSVASFAATTMAPELTDASLANTADNAIPPPPPSDPIAKDILDETPSEPEKDLTVTQTASNELPPPVKEVNETPAQVINNVEQIKDIIENIPIQDNVPAVEENVVTENETIEKVLIDTKKVSESTEPEMPAPPPQVEEPAIEKETEKEPENAEPEMPSPPAELDQNAAEDQKEIVSESSEPDLPAPPIELFNNIAEKGIEKEIVPENVEPELPAPPVEIIKDVIEKELEKEIVAENGEPEMPDPPAAVVDEPIVEKIEEENVPVIKEAEIPPPAEDSNVEKLPTPPPSICTEAGEGVTENNLLTDTVIKTETIEATSETVVNSNHVSDTQEITLNEPELKNDNETVENLKNKSKDSLGNVIETVECNGNIEEDKVNSENETVEIIPASNPVETAKSRTTLPAEEALSSPPDSLPPPPAELCADAADPATPQEPLPVSDKLADLITEVPEVPELKTETLQETTSEAAVAN